MLSIYVASKVHYIYLKQYLHNGFRWNLLGPRNRGGHNKFCSILKSYRLHLHICNVHMEMYYLYFLIMLNFKDIPCGKVMFWVKSSFQTCTMDSSRITSIPTHIYWRVWNTDYSYSVKKCSFAFLPIHRLLSIGKFPTDCGRYFEGFERKKWKFSVR